MTTPRQPYGPDDREHAEWDPYHRDPYRSDPNRSDPNRSDPNRSDADDEHGPAGWGRPPAGGWGTASTGYGEQYGGRSGGGERRGGPPGRYEVAEGRGGASASGYRGEPGYRDERYREPTRHEPSWGQGPPVAPRRSARHRRRPPWVVLGGVGVVLVAFLVLGFVAPGWFVTRVLDASAVQTGVAKILADSYGVDGVADVHCPGGVPVTAGTTFTCDATIDSDPVKIPVRLTDGKGGYEVGRPT